MTDQTADQTETTPELEAEGPLEATTAGEGLDDEALERRAEALAQIVKFGDPVLRSKASPVTEFDEALAADAERMIAIMRDGMGVGLAATQLGILRRILVFQAGADAPPTALVNPELEWSSERDAATAEEGCLSLPRVVLDIERPLYVLARGSDVTGAPVTIEASGLEARVLQHEIDHLNGVLILQRAPKDQRRGAMRALREGGTYAPPRPEEEQEREAGEEGTAGSNGAGSSGG